MSPPDSTTNTLPSTPSLWIFANDRYKRDGVSQLCLRLQNEQGFDTNLILFCCWFGTHYGIVEPALMQTLYEYSCNWNNNAVQPVRQTRGWLKALIESSPTNQQELTELREKVKEVELECERHQLDELEAQAKATKPARTSSNEEECAWKNLELLRQQMGVSDSAAVELLRELLELMKEKPRG